jgi:hypothetical protein
MVDVMDTAIGERLKKTKLLLDSVVWYDSVDGNVRNLILNWIQNDQLRAEGIDENKQVIGYYSLLTSLINPDKSFNSHFTLDDTGEFFRGMFVIVLADSLILDSDNADKVGDDGSTINLFTEHGDGIMGLTNENMAKLVAILRTKYITYTRKVLGVY